MNNIPTAINKQQLAVVKLYLYVFSRNSERMIDEQINIALETRESLGRSPCYLRVFQFEI